MIKDGEVLRLAQSPSRRHRHARPHHGQDQLALEELRSKKCQSIVFADSISAVSADDYRFSDHPALIAVFRSTFDRIAALGCDFLLTPHPAEVVFERLSGAEPLASPASAPLMPRPGTSASTPGWRKRRRPSHDRLKLTLPCTRDEAEAIGELDVETLGLDPPPTLMTREPDESRPDEWLLEPI